MDNDKPRRAQKAISSGTENEVIGDSTGNGK